MILEYSIKKGQFFKVVQVKHKKAKGLRQKPSAEFPGKLPACPYQYLISGGMVFTAIE
jgi:hypothetical protein